MPYNVQKPSNNRHSKAILFPINSNENVDFDLYAPLGSGSGFGFKCGLNLDVDFHQDQSFTVPQLGDKPQDPIVQTLERNRAYGASPERPLRTLDPKVKVVPLEDNGEGVNDNGEFEDGDVWMLPQVVALPKKHIHTWDDFNPTTPYPSDRSTPFVSEQPLHMFDAVRYHVNFKLKDPSIHFRYIAPHELWSKLQLNLLGNSSSLFVWDQVLCKFVPKTLASGQVVRITLQGVGSDVFSSVMSVFLNIGTNLRRIDEFIIRLRQSQSSPVHVSFSHSLSSVLSYLQTILSRPSPYGMRQLVGISSWYKIYDQMLNALVVLCQCDGRPPFSFSISTPHGLLTHIFSELQRMLIIKAQREVTATLAYILSTTSEKWFYQLAYSVGLIDTTHSVHTSVYTGESEAVSFYAGFHTEPLPSFFPMSLATSLTAAWRSLSILKTAGLPCQASLNIPFAWVWTPEKLEERWLHDQRDQRELPFLSGDQSTLPPPHSMSASLLNHSSNMAETDSLEDKLVNQFAIFDLTPGSHSCLLSSESPIKAPSLPSTFSTFLTTFPDSLPSLAPTLDQLTHFVLNPLSVRIAVLSNLSLRHFFDTHHLDLHLRILRSYFFLTSSSFKGRLRNALLYNESLESPASIGKLGALGVAIGLAAGLSSDKTWPPKGSDLSFSLRTVIVGSLEEDYFDNNDDENTAVDSERASRRVKNVVLDAEQKLGFGLRDLPVEDGNARWLSPVSIEALDFLYLDYKTSQPLDMIVTSQIIAKYQRVFTFLLRLMRVETVMRIIHQIIYSVSRVHTHFISKNTLRVAQTLHFQLSAFLYSLKGYIYDTVICGIFDNYLAWIDQIRDDLEKNQNRDSGAESNTYFNVGNLNIFVLGESHSKVLDRILKCCFLGGGRGKSGNRNKNDEHGVGVARVSLKNLMDLILRFGTMLMDLATTDQPRNTATAENVTDVAEEKLFLLSEEFKHGMINLITAIQRLQETQTQMRNKQHDREDGFVHDGLLARPRGRGRHRVYNYDFAADIGLATVETQAHVRDVDQMYLDELLARLDPSYWWRRSIDKARERGREEEIG